MIKLSRTLCLFASLTLWSLSAFAADNFCAMPKSMPQEKQQDALFLTAMFDADYIFRGRLFTYYNEKCDNEICAFDGLVFKNLEDIENYTKSYVETSWQEDCDKIWLFPTDWRTDKDQMFFEIKKEYLLLAKETKRGLVIFGARKGLKLKELMMQYELARIGGEKKAE